MRVKLANDWFAPNGALYRKADNPHTFPDEWADNLPKSAEKMAKGDGALLADVTKVTTPAKK